MLEAILARGRLGQGGICALIGGLAALGQAPLGIWPLTVVGVGLIFALIRRSHGPKHALGLGWMAGIGYFAIALLWIVEPFLVDVARHGWMAPFALLGVSVGFGFFWALIAWVTRVLRGQAIAFICAFVLFEAVRGTLFTGFPWAQLGHVLIDTPWLHWSSYGGSLGLTALVTLGACGVTWGIERHWAKGGTALGALAVLFGLSLVVTPDQTVTQDAPTIRIVHPNEAQEDRWDPDKIPDNFERKLEFTAGDLDAPEPDLIVWPETSIPMLLSRAEPMLNPLAAEAAGVPVVAGLLRFDGDRFLNSLIRLNGEGEVDAIYDKHHLVPFGEYVPFGEILAKFGIFGLANRTGGGFSAGPGPQIMDFGPLGTALPIICYEGVFARNVRVEGKRPDFILLITNDAWFGDLSGPYQHLAQARLRSAEQGLPMIRAANSGISAMMDPTGRVTHELGLGEAGWLDAPLPPPLPPTLYSRMGDLPIVGFFLVLLTLSGLRARRVAT